jgi:hypothetical protein
MIRLPFPTKWDTSQLPTNRRSYLDSDLSFQEIADRVLTEMQIIRVNIEPYKTPARGEPKDARQVAFLVGIGEETSDLLYNARDGLRGRYWQSPDHGFEATKHLIVGLLPNLTSFAARNPPTASGKAAPMASEDIAASLEAPSAKIWPRERDDNGTSLLVEHELVVSRWESNEQHASTNRGMWRRTPRGGEMEIKGALLGADRTEYLPEGKRDRSWQIHHFGFT